MQFLPNQIDKFAKRIWQENDVYSVSNEFSKPKCYVLEMFPYPSGSGLHVGHPLGYVAGDIYARFKRMKGYNVLHPMGYDSFGLPTEQFAIETGRHPIDTTIANIKTYRNQFDKIGLSFDWSREVITSSPDYYKWTQWIFLELFGSCYCTADEKAYPIQYLIDQFEEDGNLKTSAFSNDNHTAFSAEDWKNYSEKEKSDILMKYRLIYTSIGEVNWCEALGTVLANDEVINGRSERGNHLVVKKEMRQWSLRITAYADRLLRNLDEVDYSNSLKEQQRNWIGKSTGAELTYKTESSISIPVYTTRPDTIFGATFIVLAPEHPLVDAVTTSEYNEAINNYIHYSKSKSDIDRQAEKEVSGQFTGSYCIHPFTKKKLPIYIAEYILMGYGTGAIMAVPSEDERDRKFAEKFDLTIIEIFDKTGLENIEIGDKQGVLIHSEFINGLSWEEGVEKVLATFEEQNIGEAKTQFRLRNANFSRQRYWGEPIPILWKDNIPYPVSIEDLPIKNPSVDSFLPSTDGQSPNARNTDWVCEVEGFTREVDTMPAFAGSAWYFLRYMTPHNDASFVDKDISDYWNQVDVYIGGSEHAVGHLLYSRFFNMFLYDRGYISFEEPYKKIINQGMIQGRTQLVYRSIETPNLFISKENLVKYHGNYTAIRVDISLVDNDILDIEGFKKWRSDFANAVFDMNDEIYICGWEIEKMSKSKYNIVNPNDIIDKYGADTFRMFEMFLGPIEQGKPWNSSGIEGVFKFLRKFWNLFLDENEQLNLTQSSPTVEELKILHKTIDKVSKDVEGFSFNTSVSAFMIATNELTSLKCDKEAILLPLLRLICPFAPHIAEVIWQSLGNKQSIVLETYPVVIANYLKEDTIEYPVSINGKVRTKITIPADIDAKDAEKLALENEIILKWIGDASIKKIIFVKNRMINIVL